MQSAKHKQNNLVLYRKRMGYSQTQVAKLLGQADSSMVSHYEHGRITPSLGVALSLEVIYRTPVAFLFPGLRDEIHTRIRNLEESLLCPPGQKTLPLTQRR